MSNGKNRTHAARSAPYVLDSTSLRTAADTVAAPGIAELTKGGGIVYHYSLKESAESTLA